jgi:type IV pilus assembly protein PilA
MAVAGAFIMTEASENKGTPVFLWVLAGCGCLGFGLVVLGILAAIALPSFLNQANKARQSEAKNYVSSMLRSQQAYYIERQTFANSIDELQIGIPLSPNYAYTLETFPGPPRNVLIKATAQQEGLKSLIGVVAEVPGQADTSMTITAVCESIIPALTSPAIPTLSEDGSHIICAEGSQPSL